MGKIIVKPEKDVDFYVEWDTRVDCPVGWGSAEECVEDGIERDRLETAHAFGTSMIDGNWYGWDDREFVVHNLPGSPFMVHREDLKNMCRMLEDGEGDAVKEKLGGPVWWDNDEARRL